MSKQKHDIGHQKRIKNAAAKQAINDLRQPKSPRSKEREDS